MESLHRLDRKAPIGCWAMSLALRLRGIWPAERPGCPFDLAPDGGRTRLARDDLSVRHLRHMLLAIVAINEKIDLGSRSVGTVYGTDGFGGFIWLCTRSTIRYC